MSSKQRVFRIALLWAAMLGVPGLNADVTLRYRTEVKLNPNLPAQLAQQAEKGMQGNVPKDTLIQFKDGKGYSSVGTVTSITDFTKQEITLLDGAGKRYATLKFDQYGEAFANAIPKMPDQAKDVMAGMKAHTSSKNVSRTATIHGIEGEEHQFEMTVDAPSMPNVPPGPMIRLVVHFWMAKASETMRVPAMRELAGYNLFAAATMNPLGSMQKMFQQTPGFGDMMNDLTKEFQTGSYVTLRMQMEMFMPMLAAIAKQMPDSPLGGNFDASTPFMTMTQEMAEISTGAVAESVFQVPESYQAVPAGDILKDMMGQAQAAGKAGQ